MPFPDNSPAWCVLAASTLFSVALERKIKEVPNGELGSQSHTFHPAFFGQPVVLGVVTEDSGMLFPKEERECPDGHSEPSHPVSHRSCCLRESTGDTFISSLAVV